MLAVLDYTRCIEIKNTHSDAWNNRGNAYRILGLYEQAIHDLGKVNK
jgi:tetratricopeptide (TPR) repeat protein